MSPDRARSIFLFGANSMLGWSIFRHGGLPNVTPFCNGFTRDLPAGVDRGVHLDDELAVSMLMSELTPEQRPDLIIHCAGVCNVAKCEASPEFAQSVNVDGARILAACAPPESRIVYCSSDHVFSGESGVYDETSEPDPISVYGRTRVAAERIMLARPRTLVVRAGLWIGPSSNGRIGHLDWLRYRHRRNLPMTVVADEFRSAVWAQDAARRVAALAMSDVTGIRHLRADRAVSRPELAASLNERFAIGARFAVQHRRDRPVPHLGRVELATVHDDELASRLPAVVPR